MHLINWTWYISLLQWCGEMLKSFHGLWFLTVFSADLILNCPLSVFLRLLGVFLDSGLGPAHRSSLSDLPLLLPLSWNWILDYPLSCSLLGPASKPPLSILRTMPKLLIFLLLTTSSPVVTHQTIQFPLILSLFLWCHVPAQLQLTHHIGIVLKLLYY